MDYSEFLRLFDLRSPNLAWFLGAGASAAAGIPTAGDLVWEFKRILFCSKEHVSRKTVEDLSSPFIRQRLQSFFDRGGTYAPPDSPDEYASYFEATYPDPRDRRTYLEAFFRGARPTYGHLVLGALMRMGKARVVWTPNFDKLIEDAAAQVLGSTSQLTVATLDNAELALQAINEGRWPLLGKLHGDFQSRRLKNTPDELKRQDVSLRHALTECSQRFGLIVVGYSGRDDSVMDALEESASSGGYPAGLFWFQRPNILGFERVTRLIEMARRNGIQAETLQVPTFDELMGDIFRQTDKVPIEIDTVVNKVQKRITDNALPPIGRSWPIIRLNALPVLEYPSICRRISCEIGGQRECEEAVKGFPVIVARRNIGVLAFGSDSDLKQCFGRHAIREFDLHSMEFGRLRYDSAEHGLLTTAIGVGLARSCPLTYGRGRRSHHLRVDVNRLDDSALAPLKAVTRTLAGNIPGTELNWIEGTKLRLEARAATLWLVLQPFIWVQASATDEERFTAADFVRERAAVRYNGQYDKLLSAWISIIIGNKTPRSLQSLGIGAGVDAGFVIGKTTAFTARSRT